MGRISRKVFVVFMFLVALLMTSSLVIAGEGIRDIEVKEAVEMVAKEKNNSDFVILDVRTPGEYKDGHLPNANLIDIKSKDFSEKIDKLDRNKTYLVYCRSGKRSKMAQEKMKDMGFKNVINMLGGFMGWADGEYSYER